MFIPPANVFLEIVYLVCVTHTLAELCKSAMKRLLQSITYIGGIHAVCRGLKSDCDAEIAGKGHSVAKIRRGRQTI